MKSVDKDLRHQEGNLNKMPGSAETAHCIIAIFGRHKKAWCSALNLSAAGIPHAVHINQKEG